MKFIHTADWHLGKLLKEHSMTEDQAWLLENRFLPIVDEEKAGRDPSGRGRL